MKLTDAKGQEHELLVEEKTFKPSLLVHVLEEGDTDADLTDFDDTPYQALVLSCTCGKLDTSAKPGDDLTERFEHHVKLATLIL